MQDIAGCTGVWFNLHHFHHFLQPRHSSISSIDSGFSTCSRTGRMPRFELRLPWRCYSSSQGLRCFCCGAHSKINGTMQRTWGMEVAEVALDIFALPNQLIRWEFTTASHCLKHCPLCCARQSFNGVLENYPSEQQRFRLVKVMALFGVKSSAEEFNIFKVCSNLSTVLTGSGQLQLYSYTVTCAPNVGHL